MCINDIKNEIKYTNTLCRITLLWICYFFIFCQNVRSLATDVICFFVHYYVVKLKDFFLLDRILSRCLTFVCPRKIYFLDLSFL